MARRNNFSRDDSGPDGPCSKKWTDQTESYHLGKLLIDWKCTDSYYLSYVLLQLLHHRSRARHHNHHRGPPLQTRPDNQLTSPLSFTDQRTIHLALHLHPHPHRIRSIPFSYPTRRPWLSLPPRTPCPILSPPCPGRVVVRLGAHHRLGRREQGRRLHSGRCRRRFHRCRRRVLPEQ
jgi:hypothetical protein